MAEEQALPKEEKGRQATTSEDAETAAPTQPTTALDDAKSKPPTAAEIAEARAIEMRSQIKSLMTQQKTPILAHEREATVNAIVAKLLILEEDNFKRKALPNNLTAKKISQIREGLLDTVANAGKERIWDFNNRNDIRAAKDIFKRWEKERPAEKMAREENQKRTPHQEALKIESVIASARTKIMVMERNLDQTTVAAFRKLITTAEEAPTSTPILKIEQTLAPIFLKAQELAPHKQAGAKEQPAAPKTQEEKSSTNLGAPKTLPKNRWAYLKQFAQAWDENNARFIPSGKTIAKGAGLVALTAGITAAIDANSNSLELVDKSADALVDNADIIGIAAGSLVGLYFLARTLNAIYEVYKSSQPTAVLDNSVSAQETEENEFIEENGPTEEDPSPTPP